MKKYLKAIVRQTIDIHVHVGPEVIPRRYDVKSLAKAEKNKLAGAVAKNHFYPTIPMVVNVSNKVFKLMGSITLNWPVGGLNPEAIKAASYISDQPFFVWLPTIHAANFLANSRYEIAPEWCSGKRIFARRASDVQGISLLNQDGKLSTQAKEVAKAVAANTRAILATGHVSAEESVLMVTYAQQVGVKAILITHPIYQKINMPISTQRKLASRGCFIEICYSMYALDGISIEKITQQIKTLGPEQIILSSDVGQLNSKSPSEALAEFASLLIKQQIPVEWLKIMLVDNPRRLLSSERK